MVSSSSLRHIEPPDNKDRTAEIVAHEVVNLIRTDFHYNTKALCGLFHCERQWVDMYLQSEIEHIFVTPYFQRYILEHVHFSDDNEYDVKLRDLISHGYYFFSEKSLQEYWRTHAYAERRTVQINLAKYKARGVSAEMISRELKLHGQTPPSAKEKDRHKTAMQKLLSDKGYSIFLLSGEKSEWTPYPLPELTDKLPLTTLAAYRRSKGLGSDTASMKQLLRKGCIRIKLGNRSLWIMDQHTYSCPLTVPAGLVPPEAVQ